MYIRICLKLVYYHLVARTKSERLHRYWMVDTNLIQFFNLCRLCLRVDFIYFLKRKKINSHEIKIIVECEREKYSKTTFLH